MARKATDDERAIAEQMERALAEEPVLVEKTLEETTAPETVAETSAPPVSTPESAQPKRKRGRPSSAENALRESVAGVEGQSTSSGGAKRGPKPKGKNSDPSTLAKSLVGIHALAAMITGIQEAQLSDGEGQALAEGVIAVCDEYGFSIDGKTGAAMQLFGACAMIYGPRVFAFKMRMAQQERQARERTQTEVNTYAQTFAPGH